MRLWVIIVPFLLLLLVSCTAPRTAELERDLAEANNRTASLETQLAASEANVADLNASLENATATLKVAVKETADDIRKLDKLYDMKLDELRAVEADLASCEQELALYKPKVTTASSGGYTSIAYDDLMRNGDAYVGTKVRYRGEVLQVSEASMGRYVLRIATADYYDDVVWVEYEGPRVLEEDIVMLYGTFDGLHTYEAVLGNEITLPQITADSITVLTKAGDR